MHRETFRTVTKLAFALCALAVAALAFAPDAGSIGLGYDKLNHLLAFVVLALLADVGWPGRRRELPRWGLLLAYGLLIELVQGVLPFRDFSILDLATDAIAILLYIGLRAMASRARPLASRFSLTPRNRRRESAAECDSCSGQ